MLGDKDSLKNQIKHLTDNVFFNETDGLLYCKKCLGKKTLLSPSFNGEPPQIVNIQCECDKKVKLIELEKQRLFEREKKYKELQVASLLGEKYYNVSFETADLDRNETFINAYNRCKKFCENAESVMKNGWGIYLVGNCGSGKTFLMACMVNYLTKKHYPCLFTNFFEIAAQIKKTFSRSLYNESEFINQLTSIPFLFIDDLGTERVQKEGEDTWMQEKIYDIIDRRYKAQKPTIFSSNLTIKELITKRGIMEKTVDRIAEMGTAILHIKDISYRLKSKPKDIPF